MGSGNEIYAVSVLAMLIIGVAVLGLAHSAFYQNDVVFVSVTVPSINFTVTSGTDATFPCELYIDGIPVYSNDSVVNDTPTMFSPGVPLAEGPHLWTLNCTDSGPEPLVQSRTVVVDTISPTVSIDAAGAPGALYTNVSFDDANLYHTEVNVTDSTGALVKTVSGSGNASISMSLPPGTYTIIVSATDQAGNFGSVAREAVVEAGTGGNTGSNAKNASISYRTLDWPLSLVLVPPTPDDGTTIIQSTFSVNVSADDRLGSCTLVVGGATAEGALSMGYSHSCYLLADRNSICYGSNWEGESTNYRGGDAIAVSAGQQYTCYLLTNGNSVCYGTDASGETTNYSGGDAVAVSAHEYHTCYLLTNGNSACYGSDDDGSTTNYSGGDAIAVAAGEEHTCYLLSDGNSACYGYWGEHATVNYTGGDAIDLTAGTYHTCYLRSNGNSVCYGSNWYGESTNYSGGDAVAVAAGYEYTCYLLRNGNSTCYGYDSDGQTDNYSGGDAVAVSAREYHTCYLLSNGNSVCYGADWNGESTNYTGGDLSTISGKPFPMQVSNATANLTLATARLGEGGHMLAAVCKDRYGIVNATEKRIIGIELKLVIPGIYGKALYGDTSVMFNWTTDKAANSTVKYGLTPALGSYATDASLNFTHSITVTGLTPRAIYYYNISSCNAAGLCNESGPFDFIEDGTPPVLSFIPSTPSDGFSTGATTATVNVSSSENLSSCTLVLGGRFPDGIMSAGGYYTCYLLNSGNSMCYGDNGSGQSTGYSGGDAVAISATGDHTCYLLSNGSSACYGDNGYGQNAPYAGDDAIAISGNYGFTCYLLSDGTSACYGGNGYGQVVNYSGGGAIAVAAGTGHTCYLLGNGTSVCYGDTNCLWESPCIGSGGQSTNYSVGDAIGVAAGYAHTCYLLSNGNSACYGSANCGWNSPCTGSDGQATDYTGGDAIALAAGYYHTCYLLSGGNSVCYGRDDYGQSDPYTGGDAIAVSAGDLHTCYLLSNWSTVCYGDNSYGQAIGYAGGDLSMIAGRPFAMQVRNAGSSTTASSALTGITGGPHTYAAVCKDIAGNPNQTVDRTLTILEPLNIENVNATTLPDETSALVSWRTNRASNSTVDYGTAPDLGNTTSDSSPVLSHDILLTDLTPKIPYYYNVTSCTAMGTCTTTGPYVFIADAPPNPSFIPPTPADAAAVNYRNVTFNVSIGKNVSSCILHLNSTPISMTINNADADTTANAAAYNLPDGVYAYYANCTEPLGISNSTMNSTFTVDLTPPSVAFVLPTPDDGATINYINVPINVSVNENVSACNLEINSSYGSNLWTNIRHLGIYGGRFDYNASEGVGNYASFNMLNRNPIALGGTPPGGGHACYLLTNGNSICVGADYYGEANAYTGGDAIALSSGENHTCYLRSNGNSVCYGSNYSAEFGVSGQATSYTGGDAIALSAGWHDTCYLRSNGNGKCYGSSTDYNGGDAIALSAGPFYTCYLRSNGNVVCLGGGSPQNYTGGDAIGLAVGYSQTCFLLSNGNSSCYGGGTNYTGGDAIAVSAGGEFTCYLLSNGNSRCYGSYNNGSIFYAMPSYTGGDAIAISSAYNYVCYLRSNGNSICYGNNYYGQASPYPLGNIRIPFSINTNARASLPMSLHDASAATSADHTLTGLLAGTYGYDVNCTDVVGNSNKTGNRTFTVVPDVTPPSLAFVQPTPANGTTIYTHNVSVNVSASKNLSQCNLTLNTTEYRPPATIVASGYSHTCYLLSNGSSICYGYNFYGQSTNYTGGGAIVSVAAGGDDTCYLLSDGNSACYGYNGDGQADNYTGGGAIAVSAGLWHTCYLLSNGTSLCLGRNDSGQCTPYTGGDAVALSVGSAHTCYLLSSGNSACYGWNDYGQSDSYTGGDAIAVAAGWGHTCYLLSSGNSVCYGDYYDSGLNTVLPMPAYSGGDATTISSSSSDTCYLLSSGNSVCYGDNYSSMSTSYTGGDAIAVSIGGDHTCYLLSNGSSICYGANSYGQSTNYTAVIPTVLMNITNASAGTSAIAGIDLPHGTYKYSVACADRNGNSNTTSDRIITLLPQTPAVTFVPPTPNDGETVRAPLVPFGISVDLNVSACDLNLGTNHTHMNVQNADANTTAGVNLTFALPNGVYNYNANCTSTENGSNTTINRTFTYDLNRTPPSIAFAPPTPPNGSTVYHHDVSINVSTNDNLSSCMLTINTSDYHAPAIAVSASGYSHTCYVLNNGNSACYGFDNSGDTTDYLGGDAIAVAEGDYHTCYLLSDGNSLCYGDNSLGQATDYTGGNATAVSARGDDTCYLLSNGTSACYGDNYYGQTANYTGGDATAVAVADDHICYLLSNGTSACYGDNYYGQSTNYTGGDAIGIATSVNEACYLLRNDNSVCYGGDLSGGNMSYSGGDAIALSMGYGPCYLLSNGNSACYGYGYPYYGAINYTGGDAIAVSSGTYVTCYLLSNGNSVCYGDNGAGRATNYTNGPTIPMNVTNASVNASALASLDLPYGFYKYHAECWDLNGNSNRTSDRTFTTDLNRSPPSISFVPPTPDDGVTFRSPVVPFNISVNMNATVCTLNLLELNLSAPLNISAGLHDTCYLLADGESRCYGYNAYGETNNYVGHNAVGVATGGWHTCHLLSDGNSVCYGDTTCQGYLPCMGPEGAATNYTGDDAIAVSAGWATTCYLLSNGNSTCYGDNTCGGNTPCSGQSTDYTGGDAIAVSAGDLHTCFLRANGTSVCYGYNGSGQATGYTGGDAVALSAGAAHTCYLLSNGNSTCYGIADCGWGTSCIGSDGPSTSYTGGDAIAVSAGGLHTCYLLNSGNSVCYGETDCQGAFPCLGSEGESTDYDGGNAIAVSAGDGHTCYLLSDGNVTCYGRNDDGRLNPLGFLTDFSMAINNADANTTAGVNLSGLPARAYGYNADCIGNNNVSGTSTPRTLILDVNFIPSCAVINESGSYLLINNLVGAPNDADGRPACIVINAPNVSLDCMNHSITDNGVLDAYGIYALPSTSGVDIRNCNISRYLSGLVFNQTTEAAASGNRLRRNLGSGIAVYGSSAALSSNFYYNNPLDLVISGAGTLNVSGDVFSNPSGSLQNYTTLSINDTSGPGEAYSVTWSSSPAAPPAGNVSFAQKFVAINTLEGTPSIDMAAWSWADSELLPGYNESRLSLLEYNGGWALINASPDTSANTLSASSIDASGTFAILHQGNVTPPSPSPFVSLVSPANASSSTSTVTFRFTAVNYAGSTMSCVLYLDGGANQTDPSVANDTPSSFTVAGIAIGQHNWSVGCTDLANNTVSSELRLFSVTPAPPPSPPPPPSPSNHCAGDGNCASNQACTNGRCTEVTCSCGVIENHQCTAYECCANSDCGTTGRCENNTCITPLPNSCTSDSNCGVLSYCNIAAGACVPVECPCGNVSDHHCTAYECCRDSDCAQGESCAGHACITTTPVTPPVKPPVTTCNVSDQCLAEQVCSNGVCSNVTGQCGYAANHAWVTYACGPEPGCPSCPSGSSCTDHACVPGYGISAPDTGFVGEGVKVTAINGTGPCGNCEITWTSPSGRTGTGTTDANGTYVIPLNEKGTYMAVLANDPTKSASVNALSKPAPNNGQTPLVVLLSEVPSYLWLLVLLLIAGGAIVYLRGRGKAPKPPSA